MRVTPITPPHHNIWQGRRPTQEELIAREKSTYEQLMKEKQKNETKN